MTNHDKIKLLEELFEVEEGALDESTQLDDLENWDSMVKLSLIVLMDEKFGKKITGEQIRTFITINDIVQFM